MPIQTITSGSIENAQAIVIAECLYTAESECPTVNMFSRFAIGKGQKQVTVPKVGQMTAVDVEDGIDLTDSQNIGMTTTDLTPAEVGLKVILTDRLVLQFSGDVFKVIGRQMGDAIARKRDRDGIALFSALNSGTAFGADNKYLSLPNTQACIVAIRSRSVPNPVHIVHHPSAVGYLAGQSAGIASITYYGTPDEFRSKILKNFWRISIDGVNVFWDANIDKITGYDSGYGAIFSESAFAYVVQKEPYTERERDASLRGTEVVMVTSYGVFELDDNYGAPLQYEIGEFSTAA